MESIGTFSHNPQVMSNQIKEELEVEKEWKREAEIFTQQYGRVNGYYDGIKALKSRLIEEIEKDIVELRNRHLQFVHYAYVANKLESVIEKIRTLKPKL